MLALAVYALPQTTLTTAVGFGSAELARLRAFARWPCAVTPNRRPARPAADPEPLNRKSSEDSSGRMRSETAVRRRLTGPATSSDDARALAQVNLGVVGLAGLEPAASFLSGIEGSALCGPAFPQVAGDRKGRRDAF
jgi:hypothetical protein